MLRKNNRRLWFAVLSVISITAMGQQTVYRWMDKNGQVHYGDRPPSEGTAHEAINRTKALSHPEVSTAEQVRGPAISEPAKTEPKSSGRLQEPPQPTSQRNPEYCQQAKDNLWQIENSARVRVLAADGQYRFLSPEEKEAARKESLKLVEAHCD